MASLGGKELIIPEDYAGSLLTKGLPLVDQVAEQQMNGHK